ncbi:proton-coupled folate transporter [Sitodiplosis mosellana]|uniref:proton-coupled folate transporter n=1 Tax=Sitodiplosis mosellana TaxID=263140 RepID=UPI0024443FFB|nr:proton-coupled folate transporter [Sitodiplosis mosellana]
MNPTITVEQQPWCWSWFRYITVEPTMFLYMFAFQLTSVVEQDLFVKKACLVNHNFTEEICDNLKNYTDTFYKEVQITVSTFHQWNHIAGYIFTIVIALFIGSWSDRRGRKIPLLIGLTGKLIYVLGLLLNIYNDKWPVEYIIYTATLPSALTGVDIAIFASAFAYISDVSSVENRTLRVTILEVCYLITFPTGIALGSYLFNVVLDHSYFIMFSINAVFLMAAFLYSIFNLKWSTSSRQRSITEVGCNGILGDFFDKKHIVDTVSTLTKKRSNHRRMFLWIFLVAMFFYTFQRDERNYTYLYTGSKFGWQTAEFSTFKVFQSSTQILMVFCGIPIMTKLLEFRDTTIAMVGAYCFATARIFFTLAEIPEIFYVGAAISSMGPVGGPILRSMTSKVVPSSERGKVFAVLSACDNAVPLISSILYTQVYNWTVNSYPGIYILTFITQMILFFLMLTVHVVLKGDQLVADDNAWEIVNEDTANNVNSTANVIDTSVQTEDHEKC